MISSSDYYLLSDLVERRLDPDGFIYFGVADFYELAIMRGVDRLIDLDFITPVYLENTDYVDPKVYYDFREYPYLVLPLGQLALVYPSVVVERDF